MMANPLIEDDIVNDFAQVKLYNNEDIKIFVGKSAFSCNRNILISSSKYFEALFNFDEDRKEVRLESDLTEQTAKQIFDFLSTGNLTLDVENFQDLLAGSIFLGCPKLEERITKFVIKNFTSDSVFNVYNFSKSIGCENLAIAAESHIETVFNVFLKASTHNGTLVEFMALDGEELKIQLQENLQCDEKLLLYCVLGWLDNHDENISLAVDLLNLLNFQLIPEFVKRQISNGCVYPSIIAKILDSRNSIRPDCETRDGSCPNTPFHGPNYFKRWPSLVVSILPGRFRRRESNLLFLDLTERLAQWRYLSKNIVHLDLLSGFTLAYVYPRIYFLGARRWQYVHWYNIETDSWGSVWEVSMLPKLLAGTISHNDKIYLVGGVNVEEWNQGSIEVNATPSVHVMEPNSETLKSLPSLPKGVSSPSVAVYDGYLYAFGGLDKRIPTTKCYRLNIACPEESEWEELSPTLAIVCYPATVVDQTRHGIWMIGGMRIPNRNEDDGQEMRGETYVYKPGEDSWKQGPNLNIPRKSAFAYVVNKDIYVSGGTSEDLKPVTTTEVLRNGSDVWEKLENRSNRYSCSANSTLVVHKPYRLIKQ